MLFAITPDLLSTRTVPVIALVSCESHIVKQKREESAGCLRRFTIVGRAPVQDYRQARCVAHRRLPGMTKIRLRFVVSYEIMRVKREMKMIKFSPQCFHLRHQE